MTTTRAFKLPAALAVAALTLFAATSAHARDSLDGRIKVVNERMAPVSVSIDGDRMTRLGPGESRVFKGVPNGVRLLRVHGRRGNHQLTEKLPVPIDGVARYRVEARFGQATIYNDSGVRMRLVLDGRNLGVARAGESIESWPMAAGTYTLEARPADRRHQDGPALTRRIDVRRGQQARHAVGPWYSRLEVVNPFPFRAQLFIDGERVEKLRPGQSLTVARQLPGDHRLVLKRRGRVLASRNMRLVPGRQAEWRPVDSHHGDLRVSNNTGRRVEVQIDGRSMGRLDNGASRTFADLDAGVHVVTLVRRGRVVESQRIRVAAHDIAEMVAYRPATYRPGRRDGRRDDAPAPIARR